MQLLPRFINFIGLSLTKDSKTLIFIFKFSNRNSVLFLSLATMPPTLAAQFTITSGLKS